MAAIPYGKKSKKNFFFLIKKSFLTQNVAHDIKFLKGDGLPFTDYNHNRNQYGCSSIGNLCW